METAIEELVTSNETLLKKCVESIIKADLGTTCGYKIIESNNNEALVEVGNLYYHVFFNEKSGKASDLWQSLLRDKKGKYGHFRSINNAFFNKGDEVLRDLVTIGYCTTALGSLGVNLLS